jgi:hypothetical protein
LGKAHVEKERDELLVEKASWTTSSALPEGQEGADAEKAELIKARDEATAQAKVYISHNLYLGEN